MGRPHGRRARGERIELSEPRVRTLDGMPASAPERSRRQVSILRPHPYEGCALPAELLRVVEARPGFEPGVVVASCSRAHSSALPTGCGAAGGIRTRGPQQQAPRFQRGPFVHSGTPPRDDAVRLTRRSRERPVPRCASGRSVARDRPRLTRPGPHECIAGPCASNNIIVAPTGIDPVTSHSSDGRSAN